MAYQDIDGNDVDGNGRELYEPAAPAPQAEGTPRWECTCVGRNNKVWSADATCPAHGTFADVLLGTVLSLYNAVCGAEGSLHCDARIRSDEAWHKFGAAMDKVEEYLTRQK